MSTETPKPEKDPKLRFVEYQTDSNTLSVILDTTNHHAWIESTLSVPIVP